MRIWLARSWFVFGSSPSRTCRELRFPNIPFYLTGEKELNALAEERFLYVWCGLTINCDWLKGSWSAPMRPTFKLIPDFILPHLERRTYGRHLVWEDREQGSFKVSRIHQSSELWSDDCIGVYKAWSLEKKLWKLDDSKRITKAKHRLITALRRSPVIEVLKKESAYYRFRFIRPIKTEKSSSADDSDVDSRGHLLELERNKDFKTDTDSSSLADEKQPKVKEVYITVISRTNNNESGLNAPSKELDNEFKKEFTMLDESCDIYPGAYNSDEDNTWWSSKCCCDILLDSTVLRNERCIWHGINT